MESNVQKKKRGRSPRALDEQSSSDETAGRTNRSRHENTSKQNRDRRNVEVAQIGRRYDDRSRSREKERDSYRREQRWKSKSTR